MKLLRFAIVTLAVVGYSTSAAVAQCTSDAECYPIFPPVCSEYFCVDGHCTGPHPKNCDDGDDCTIDGCSAGRGGCYHDPKCPSDGLVCNGEEYCCTTLFCLAAGLYGTCRSPGRDCGDSNPCTCDSCQEPTGCQHVPIDCNDGNACTADKCEPSSPGLGDDCNAAAICVHDPIASCCQNATDCRVPCRTNRTCVANLCTEGTPLSCDDGDPLTIDACDPSAGCTHTSPTTTTLAGALPCRSAAECVPDADPCTIEACDPTAGCVSRPLSGFEGLACVCGRADPASCELTEETRVPRKVNAKRRRGCALIERATTHASSRARFRLMGRAGKVLIAAQRRLAKAKTVGAECRDDLGRVLSDAVTRVGVLRDQL